MRRGTHTGKFLFRVFLLVVMIASSVLPTGTVQGDNPSPLRPAGLVARPDLPPAGIASQGAEPEPVVPDQPVGERVAGRTAYTRTERNTDGTYTTTLSARPLHWQDKSSREWKPFDNTLRPADSADSARGYAYTSRGNGASIGFGKRAEVVNDRPVLRVATENASLVMTALGANPSGMAAGGAKLSYTEAYPDTDLRYTLDNERVKEDIVLKKAPATTQAATYRYDLDLEGVIATKQADGAIEFRDPTGKAVLRMPAPFMTDSSGQSESGYSDSVVVTLMQLGGGKVRLEYAPDLAWLRDAARVYPVTLDPSVEQVVYAPDGTVGQDAAVYEAAPWDTTAHGATATLEAGRRPTDGYRRDSLVQFPALSDLPQDSIVTSASLKLYAATGAAGTPVQAHRNTAAWDEAGVTWATAPGVTPYVWDTVNSAAPGWNSYDVGDLARAWVSGQYPNHGLRLMAPNALAGQSVAFVSSDSTDTLHHPQLVVRYVPAARYGWDEEWTFVENQYDGNTYSGVNISNGNIAVTHEDGWIEAPGFLAQLSHTYSSQSPYGQGSYYEQPGSAVYGEGWAFSQDVRLHEAGDGAMALRDGADGRDRVYAESGATGTTQNYHSPPDYGFVLTKDLAAPAGSTRVYKLAPPDGDGETAHFDSHGRQTRRENGWGEHLTYAYDALGRLTHITQMDGRSVVLEYGGPGNPARLSRITEIPEAGQTAGRVSTYGYTANGDLSSVTHDVGTVDEYTISFYWGIGRHFLGATPTGGHRSSVAYRIEKEWDTAGAAEGFTAEGQATAVAQSAERHFRGAGSLRVDVGGVTNTAYARAAHPFVTPPTSWNTVPQDLMSYVWMPAGAGLESRLVLRDPQGRVQFGPWWPLSGGAWTEVRLPGARVDPSQGMAKVSVELRTSAGAPAFTGSVWLDHMLVRGVVESFTDDEVPQATLASFGYNWGSLSTTISAPGADPIVQPGTYSYDSRGMLTSDADPVEAYWTPERMADAQPLPVPQFVADPAGNTTTPPQPEGPEEWYAGGDETGVPPYQESDTAPPSMTTMDPDTSAQESAAASTPVCIDSWHPWPCTKSAPASASYPYPGWWRANGRMYFRDGKRGRFHCSATVVTSNRRNKEDGPAITRKGNRSLVVTAGHCVHSGRRGARPYTNVAFAPGYHQKASGEIYIAPYTAPFTLNQITETRKPLWSTSRRRIHIWGFATNKPYLLAQGDARYDFAFLRVHKKKFDGVWRPLHSIIPFASINFNYQAKSYCRKNDPTRPEETCYDRYYWVHGYPIEKTADVDSNGRTLWQCKSKYWQAVGAKAPKPFKVGCWMSQGSSGGGWFSPWDNNGRSTLFSVESTGEKVNIDNNGGVHLLDMIGPYFGGRARDLWRLVRAKGCGPNNCR